MIQIPDTTTAEISSGSRDERREEPQRRPIRKRGVKTLRRHREKLLTFDNIAIATFMVGAIGLYYPMTIMFVWLGYAALALALGIRIFQAGGIPRNSRPFVALSVLFGFFSLASMLWAFNEQYCVDSTMRMLRGLAMGIGICMLIRTRQQFNVAMLWISIAAVVYAMMYLQFIDLAKLAAARMASTLKENVDGLPNYNVVAMYVAFSCIYFFFCLVSKKLHFTGWIAISLMIIVGVAFIMIFGSRKSILAVVLAFLIFFLAQSSGKKKTQLLILVGIAVCLILSFIPAQYLEYVLERMLKLTENSGSLERADRMRIMFVEKGLEYIAQSPLVGHGFDNFSQLLGRDTGIYFYAHNNFIEVLSDLGLVGFVIYYGIYWEIAKCWWKTRHINPASMLIAVTMCIILFNGLFIVYISDPYVWILLGLMYVGARGFREDRILAKEKADRQLLLKQEKARLRAAKIEKSSPR